jgi:hypothetical protein
MNLNSTDLWAIFWVGLFSYLCVDAVAKSFSAKYRWHKDAKSPYENEEDEEVI